jgi:uncharacterized Zn finger protein
MAKDSYYPKYVPVAERRKKAQATLSKRKFNNEILEPVVIEGIKIAKTFWGKAWCEHLEGYSDYDNRLPRGRTYARNGSIIDLKIEEGNVRAMVVGSSIYKIKIEISVLDPAKWKKIQKACSGQIGSLLELLQGQVSNDVLKIVTDRTDGLFPDPKEIKMTCDCPDWADMCKHLAAVLYGIGSRLDHHPGLLFQLRGVNQEDLIQIDQGLEESFAKDNQSAVILAEDSLSDIFGIDFEVPDQEEVTSTTKEKKKTSVRKSASQKTQAPKKTASGVKKRTTAADKRKSKTKGSNKSKAQPEIEVEAKTKVRSKPKAKPKTKAKAITQSRPTAKSISKAKTPAAKVRAKTKL